MENVAYDTLDNDALLDELDRLTSEERNASARRSTLHDRLSFLGAGDPQVDGLRKQEHELSEQRRSLHTRIGSLRDEQTRRGLAPRHV